jgi:hypothetical protein
MPIASRVVPQIITNPRCRFSTLGGDLPSKRPAMFEIEALDFFSSSRLLRILEGSSAPDRECDARRMPPGKLVFPAVPPFFIQFIFHSVFLFIVSFGEHWSYTSQPSQEKTLICAVPSWLEALPSSSCLSSHPTYSPRRNIGPRGVSYAWCPLGPIMPGQPTTLLERVLRASVTY